MFRCSDDKRGYNARDEEVQVPKLIPKTNVLKKLNEILHLHSERRVDTKGVRDYMGL